MERYKVCSFIGHREIELTEELKQKTKEVIETLITEHNVLTFLFGSRSSFNYLCHSIVTELKEKYSDIKRISYTCKNETCILEFERKNGKKFIHVSKNKILNY